MLVVSSHAISRTHMLTYSLTLFSNWLFLVHSTYFCAFIVSCMFMMLCLFIYYLNSGVSANKHELIQVIVPTNVNIHKNNYIQRNVGKNHSIFGVNREWFFYSHWKQTTKWVHQHSSLIRILTDGRLVRESNPDLSTMNSMN